MKKIKIFHLFFFLIFSTVSGQEQMQTVIQQGHPSSILSVAISHNGRWVATASKDKTIKIWDLSSGKEIRTMAGHQSEVVAVIFSPDDRYIASSSWDRTIRIWNVISGQEEKKLTGHEKLVSSIDFHPDGDRLVSVSVDRKGIIWDLETEAAVQEFVVDPGQYGPDIHFNPDGKFLGLGNDDGEVLQPPIPYTG